jgi:SAM-dependent methyltransferase
MSRLETHNRRVFESDDVVAETAADERGLFEQEAKAIDRYFTDGDAVVLDVGCGTGRTTNALVERGFAVVGLDASETMLRRAAAAGVDAPLVRGDACALPFDDETFASLLFSYNGLDYLHPVGRRLDALAELFRVLEPGGVALFSSHNAWYRFPALAVDWAFLKRTYLDDGNLRRLGSPYKREVDGAATLETYFTTPPAQRRQLSAVGFTLEAVVGKRNDSRRYFELMPYYVARK